MKIDLVPSSTLHICHILVDSIYFCSGWALHALLNVRSEYSKNGSKANQNCVNRDRYGRCVLDFYMSNKSEGKPSHPSLLAAEAFFTFCFASDWSRK